MAGVDSLYEEFGSNLLAMPTLSYAILVGTDLFKAQHEHLLLVLVKQRIPK